MRHAFLVIVALLATSSIFAATYYVSPAGSDSNPGTILLPWLTIQKAASELVAGDTVLIRGGTYRESVIPANSGTAGAFITYAAYPGERPVLDGDTVTLGTDFGLIDITHRSYIRVTGLTIMNSGPTDTSAGIIVDESDHIVLDHNSTYHTRSSGIGVWASSDVTVTDNDIRMACYGGGNQECLTMATTRGFEIANNVVHDGAPDVGGGEGICIKHGSSNGSVHDNDVHGLQRVTIYVDGWNAHTYDIEIYRNIAHDTGHEGIAVASEMGGLVEHIDIYNNLVYHAGGNGIIVAPWGDTAVPEHPLRTIRILNNTVVDNGSGTYGGGISVENPWAADVVVRNNITTGNYAFQLNSAFAIPQLSIDHNLIDELRGMEPGETLGTEHQQGSASFVDAAAHDFHLSPASIAIDHGSPIEAPLEDYDRGARPKGSEIDIGAFEYSASPPPRRRGVLK